MSDGQPWKDECDTCGHERWNHGEDEGRCTHGWEGDCDCQAFSDEERDAALAHWIALVKPGPNRGECTLSKPVDGVVHMPFPDAAVPPTTGETP